jgi:hypothetical protein
MSTKAGKKVEAESDEKLGETYDADTETLDPTTRRIDLSNLRDVRLEMAHVYREVDAGRLKSQEGTRRVYILRQIGDLIVTAELEKRVLDLEEVLKTWAEIILLRFRACIVEWYCLPIARTLRNKIGRTGGSRCCLAI